MWGSVCGGNNQLLLLVAALLLQAQSFHLTMAVDRSKFRTCDQTSFCRRHRKSAHGSLFRYKLVPKSIQFHYTPSELPNQNANPNPNAEEGVEAAVEKESEDTGGVWQSIQRRLLGKDSAAAVAAIGGGGGGASHNKGGLDPYVRGPLPTLTGRLQNTVDQKEELIWSVTALQAGLIRMRITEVYGHSGSAHEHARVTYDDLVLEVDQLQHAGHALWIPPTADATLDATASIGRDMLERVLQLRKVAPSDHHKYTALQYGDSADASDPSRMILLIQLEPFAVALYREQNLEAGPVVQLGTEQMMHFEVRRFPDNSNSVSIEKESDENDSKEETNKEEAKEEKEIVGYWEDGLAIYADGTREEKKVVEDDTHRRLTEAELDQEGLWEERFGSHTDSKPYGPMSVGLDVSFPSSTHLFGIPEHASSSQLRATVGEGAHYKEPYRLYNLDVFEYELDETMALYGHVPLIVSQSVTTGSAGVFWFNPTETFVDVSEPTTGDSLTHWISESGVVDVFLLPGPDPGTLYRQYAILTGTTPLPPMFSLGYHQCRWNYKDEKDVAMVHGKFEELDFPYDVLWLDIEHTDGKRYFTWDKNLFPNPKVMQQNLAAQGRRMVTIVDPHIFRDEKYYIHKAATAKGLYVKDKDGSKDYDGWCWPGSSSYLDFTAEHVRSWWAEQFGYNKYVGSTPTLFTWNDMNEPSVFNGPEVSMQKDLRNLNGEEHREWHNLYGMLFHRATGEGQVARNKDHNIRPFVLSRAFFAGSQKYGAIWTGDNTAEWGHLAIAAPMLLSLNTAALSFVGADIGGFFGNPDAELITRWMQAAAYQPFFRGHAHHDSKRREPWMFGEDTMVRLRRASMTRYALLPYWYTLFYQAETTGMPVMRMMWMHYPHTQDLFALDDQYLVGSDLLVKPVIGQGATDTAVVFPTDHLWYSVETLKVISSMIAPHAVESVLVPADIDTIPVYQRGGSIVSRKLRLRRSAMMMKTDPYTLYVALDDKKMADGFLHMDDEETYSYRNKSEFADATFTANFGSRGGQLRNVVVVGAGWVSNVEEMSGDRIIERIIVMGVVKPPSKLVTESGVVLAFTHTVDDELLVIRKPELSALHNWTIALV